MRNRIFLWFNCKPMRIICKHALCVCLPLIWIARSNRARNNSNLCFFFLHLSVEQNWNHHSRFETLFTWASTVVVCIAHILFYRGSICFTVKYILCACIFVDAIKMILLIFVCVLIGVGLFSLFDMQKPANFPPGKLFFVSFSLLFRNQFEWKRKCNRYAFIVW